MVLLNSFDPFEDFYTVNPQLKIIFKEEFKAKVPSKYMWALFLYAHPDSKFFNESPQVRLDLIKKDYLKDDKFSLEDYSSTLEKLESLVLTKAQRALMRWERSLHERDDFFSSVPYSIDNYEMKDKMLANTQKLWDQYESILAKLSAEKLSTTHGDIEESFLEKIS